MSTAIENHRPGVAAWVTLIRCEAKMVIRDTAGLIVPIGLPLLILVMSASSASDEIVANGRTALDLFVLPLALTMVVATVGIINMPSFLSYYRRTGILRRLSVTPASPTMVLVAQVVVSVIQTTIGLGAAIAVAFLGFGANPPVHLGTALGVYVLVMAAMYALGMLVAAVAPTPNSAVAIGLVMFFALGALGGMFGGPDALPDALATIGDWLPFGASVDALAAAWGGEPVAVQSLISLGVTTVLGVGVAAALFRWE
ncbi:ABC transporter permease [Actinoalloteichus hymeniacidonis]|uniref:ABC-type multidrug transport system, permease component n=1 Tax=Actinoalloteichus hymeniacidonis TaxID=340345 RepID=A0AAC9HU10_9PSEU|nr:ABC transporter permease [Actinoalloteichus hymeniacidonis]AOS65569.1 ABC-type multidrug transport system, permease component [Actinoalloteichus hymeniacidonis]MBB5906341.1 ABC-2 type transport system permease protein [Actinoalloteichus hymeniacidonis]